MSDAWKPPTHLGAAIDGTEAVTVHDSLFPAAMPGGPREALYDNKLAVDLDFAEPGTSPIVDKRVRLLSDWCRGVVDAAAAPGAFRPARSDRQG
jgi:hypothetical protein